MILLPAARGVLASAGDPLYANVVALLHLDTATGSALTNNAGSGPAFSMPNGATISTTQSQFGGHSCRFLGANGSAVVGATNAAYQAGSGDFCIEGWARMDSTAAQNLCDFRNTSNQVAPVVYVNTDRSLRYFVSNADKITSAINVWATLTWFSWAVARVSGTTRLFVNGTQVGSSFTDANNYNASSSACFGGAFNNTALSGADGYLDELRLTIGAGRYSANYTPSTTAFPNHR